MTIHVQEHPIHVHQWNMAWIADSWAEFESGRSARPLNAWFLTHMGSFFQPYLDAQHEVLTQLQRHPSVSPGALLYMLLIHICSGRDQGHKYGKHQRHLENICQAVTPEEIQQSLDHGLMTKCTANQDAPPKKGRYAVNDSVLLLMYGAWKSAVAELRGQPLPQSPNYASAMATLLSGTQDNSAVITPDSDHMALSACLRLLLQDDKVLLPIIQRIQTIAGQAAPTPEEAATILGELMQSANPGRLATNLGEVRKWCHSAETNFVVCLQEGPPSLPQAADAHFLGEGVPFDGTFTTVVGPREHAVGGGPILLYNHTKWEAKDLPPIPDEWPSRVPVYAKGRGEKTQDFFYRSFYYSKDFCRTEKAPGQMLMGLLQLRHTKKRLLVASMHLPSDGSKIWSTEEGQRHLAQFREYVEQHKSITHFLVCADTNDKDNMKKEDPPIASTFIPALSPPSFTVRTSFSKRDRRASVCKTRTIMQAQGSKVGALDHSLKDIILFGVRHKRPTHHA